MSHKLGFWSVFAIVISAQIGSGIFMLPAALAPFGPYGLAGWVISSFGAIALAMVFARLCSLLPKTGGPHVYALEAFGPRIGFFTGWTYWVVSWVSTTAVVVASVGYLDPLFGPFSPETTLSLQLTVLFGLTALNCLGVYASGMAEFVLTVLKFIPLVILPALALAYFNSDNITMSSEALNMPIGKMLGHVVLLTLWGFIGLETATTPAGSIENPSKTIPRAIVLGTLTVAAIYIFNSIGILGAVPGANLAQSKAPYADMTQHLFGGNWYLLISLIASVLCFGTLNAWILSSGQIALGLASDQLLPRFFAQTNKHGAPYVALLISSLGTAPLLVLTTHSNLAAQITMIIDFSVTAFLFVYAVCCLALFKLTKSWSSLVALTFCGWILSETTLTTLATASLFVFSGVLIKIFHRPGSHQNQDF
jgi:APA family basic amino acid/polyamine antiporter